MTFFQKLKYRYYRSYFYKGFWHTRDYIKWCCGYNRVVWMDFNEPEPEEEERLDELKKR